jgi:O-antigen ligase
MSRNRSAKKEQAAEAAQNYARSRKKEDSGGMFSGKPAAPGIAGRVPELLLSGQLAIIVAATLIPSEGAISQASHLILIVLQMILFAATMFSQVQSERRFRFGVEEVLLVIAGLLIFVSYWFRFDAINGRLAGNALWVWLFLLVAFLTLRRLLVTEMHRQMTAVVLLGLAVALAMHGLYQTAVTFPAQRIAFEQNPDAVLAEAGVNAPEGSVLRVQFQNRLNSLEPFSTFALTNSLAAVLAAAICFVTVIVGKQLVKSPGGWKQAIPLGVILFLLLCCFLLTKSRSAFLAVGFTLFVALAWTLLQRSTKGISPLWIGGGLMLLLVLVGATALLGGLDMQVLSEAPLSVRYRLEYWQASAELIREHPVLGVGPGNFQIFYTHAKLPQASETVADPHNFIVEMATNFGLPACLLILTALVWAAVVSARSIQLMEKGCDKSVAENQTTDNVGNWIVLSGAVVGTLIAFPAGVLSGFSPPVDVIPFLAIGFVGTYLVLDSDDASHLHGYLSFAALCAATVICIHLLASGGISFPGVALMLWGWLALALPPLSSSAYDNVWFVKQAKRKEPVADSSSKEAEDDEGYEFDPHKTAWILSGAVGLILVAGCYLTLYSPVLQSRAAIERATWELEQGNTQAGRASIAEAAALDPAWVEPWNAEFMIAAATADEQDANMTRLENMTEEIRRRSGPSSTAELSLGYGWLGVYRQTNTKPALRQAVTAFERAAEFYPADAFTRAELAWAYHLVGNDSAAKTAACRALELDNLHPHAERKLKERKLQDPEIEEGNARTQMEKICGGK